MELEKGRTKNCQKSSFCCDGKAKVRISELTKTNADLKHWTEPCLKKGWDLAEVELWMRSSRMVRASGCQCRSRISPGFDPSILRHSGIWGAADPEAVLNTVHSKKIKNPPFKKKVINSRVCTLHLSENISFEDIEVLWMTSPACSWGTRGLEWPYTLALEELEG